MFEFDKVYVNCVADESLYGKYGFFSDSLEDLKQRVINKSLKFWGRLSKDKSNTENYPFVRAEDDLHYRYFYYDPKLFALIGEEPDEYVTYRELSRWLAQGNGEGLYINPSKTPHLTFTELRYLPVDGNQPVQGIVVRWWNEDEWYVPSKTYLGLESESED